MASVPVRDFVAWIDPQDAGGPDRHAWVRAADHGAGGTPDAWRSMRVGDVSIAYLPRARTAPVSADAFPTLLVGDPAEWDAFTPLTNHAGCVPVVGDPSRGAVAIATSVVGLPPVYLHETGKRIVAGSDLFLMSRTPGTRFALDPDGVADLARFGHPVEQRTLFRDTRLLPSGGVLRVAGGSTPLFENTWDLPAPDPLDQEAFIELQVEAFTRAVARLDLATSFLSLTAGLDTRAIFAVLTARDRLIPATTMTGRRRSLDARIAARLCRAHGIAHTLVTFDERYTRDLSRFTETACRLSGGVASLRQAPEVYLYDQAPSGRDARLSGNLGNQVGRGGTEGVSLRGASHAILDPALRGTRAAEHWLSRGLAGASGHDRVRFILRSEIPFASVANYSIGNRFAMQQSPYANRGLVETLARRPPAEGSSSGSRLRMRLRDLRHRFLGEPARASFQRTLVARLDGAAARIPINWGWRAAGGVSLPGLLLGGATLAGMAARATGMDDGLLRAPLAWSGLPALHDFHESRRWLRNDLADFVRDTLAARDVRDAGLFDRAALDRVLEEQFGESRDRYPTVTLALDLALAHRFYCTGNP